MAGVVFVGTQLAEKINIKNSFLILDIGSSPKFMKGHIENSRIAKRLPLLDLSKEGL